MDRETGRRKREKEGEGREVELGRRGERETEKGRDGNYSTCWHVKLFSFFLSAGHNYHVTVPYQPMSVYSEGLLRLGRTDTQISILPPDSRTPILNLSFSEIRRFGYQVRTTFSHCVTILI